MSNVISFQAALDRRNQAKAVYGQGAEIAKEYYETIVNFYQEVLRLLEEDQNPPIAKLFYQVLLESMVDERFKDSMELYGAMLLPSNRINENDDLSKIVLLSNTFYTDAVPQNTLNVLALGTQDMFQKFLGIEIEARLAHETNPLVKDRVIDLDEAKAILHGYWYEHPDVDDPVRGCGGSNLVFSVHAIEKFYEAGYHLQRYVYNVDYVDGKKKPLPIVMEFIHPDPDNHPAVYLYFDFEAMMRSVDLYFEQAFGVTLPERYDIVNNRDN